MSPMPATPRSRALTLGALLAALTLLLACGGSGETTDPDGRIRYVAPAGWELIPGSNGTRYRAGDGPLVTTIQVNTLADDGGHDIVAAKRVWLQAQQRSGHEILADEPWSDDHHRGHQYAHTYTGHHGDGIWHHVLARGDGYRIAAHLQTTPGRYDDDRAVFERVLASIRPVR